MVVGRDSLNLCCKWVDIWFFILISKILNYLDFRRFKSNLQNPNISCVFSNIEQTSRKEGRMGAFQEYDQYDGLGLVELVKKKEISPAEICEEAISRIEKVNPQINAVVTPSHTPFRFISITLSQISSSYSAAGVKAVPPIPALFTA